jgi:hypothetical protein
MFKWLYNLGWLFQVAVGINLFGVTAILETIVLTAYLDSFWLGVSVAAGLEAAKVLTIVLYRVLKSQTEVDYPRGVRWATLGFRGMLFALSSACSVMFLAQQLDRPAMEQVRRADLAVAETHYRQDLATARNDYVQRRDSLTEGFAQRADREREALARRYLPAIAALESKLDTEMDNVVGGEFKGKRYRELQARLEEEKSNYSRALADSDASATSLPTAELDRIDAEWQSRKEGLAEHHAAEISGIRSADYRGDARVEHPMARAFVGVLVAVLDRRPSTGLRHNSTAVSG